MFKGLHATDGSMAAVKLIQVSRKNGKEQIDAVISEIKLLESLQHKNIVRYVGHFYTQGMMCISLELMEGGSLRGIVDKCNGLSESLAVNYVAQILYGLQYLHMNGM